MKTKHLTQFLVRKAIFLCICFSIYLVSACSIFGEKDPPTPEINACYSFDKDGRDTSTNYLVNLYTLTSLDDIDFPEISDSLIIALENHQRLLKIRKQDKVQNFGNLELSIAEMEQTIALLKEIKNDPRSIEKLEAYQIAGEKKTGNVKFTGYYTPLIQVSKKKTSKYKYPLYAKPKTFDGKLPTREEIDFESALDGLDLELAFAKSRMDIYFMQLQGSGYVQFRDGSKQMFGYGGSNGHAYRSIGRYLKLNDYRISSISEKGIRRFFNIRPDLVSEILPVNKSYSFFKPRNTLPKGAGHVPLLKGISMAVDRRHIPLGAIALASIPMYDDHSQLIGHEMKILLAQDVGGAIKGAGHIDLYMGHDEDAMDSASKYYHYGKLWLLTPKKEAIKEEVNASLSNDINI